MTPTEVRADFPAEPASAGRARRFIDATLGTWGWEELSDVAVLLVSELVSNAILHAGTVIGVVVKPGDRRVRVEVNDGSARGPARKHYSSTATTGRGLVLVERLADRWGVDRAARGKTVWFELGLRTGDLGAESTYAAHDAEAAPGRSYASELSAHYRASGEPDGAEHGPRLRAGVGASGE